MEYIGALRIAQRKKNPSDKMYFQLIAEYMIEAQKDYYPMFQIDLPKKNNELERQ